MPTMNETRGADLSEQLVNEIERFGLLSETLIRKRIDRLSWAPAGVGNWEGYLGGEQRKNRWRKPKKGGGFIYRSSTPPEIAKGDKKRDAAMPPRKNEKPKLKGLRKDLEAVKQQMMKVPDAVRDAFVGYGGHTAAEKATVWLSGLTDMAAKYGIAAYATGNDLLVPEGIGEDIVDTARNESQHRAGDVTQQKAREAQDTAVKAKRKPKETKKGKAAQFVGDVLLSPNISPMWDDIKSVASFMKDTFFVGGPDKFEQRWEDIGEFVRDVVFDSHLRVAELIKNSWDKRDRKIDQLSTHRFGWMRSDYGNGEWEEWDGQGRYVKSIRRKKPGGGYQYKNEPAGKARKEKAKESKETKAVAPPEEPGDKYKDITVGLWDRIRSIPEGVYHAAGGDTVYGKGLTYATALKDLMGKNALVASVASAMGGSGPNLGAAGLGEDIQEAIDSASQAVSDSAEETAGVDSASGKQRKTKMGQIFEGIANSVLLTDPIKEAWADLTAPARFLAGMLGKNRGKKISGAWDNLQQFAKDVVSTPNRIVALTEHAAKTRKGVKQDRQSKQDEMKQKILSDASQGEFGSVKGLEKTYGDLKSKEQQYKEESPSNSENDYTFIGRRWWAEKRGPEIEKAIKALEGKVDKLVSKHVKKAGLSLKRRTDLMKLVRMSHKLRNQAMILKLSSRQTS